MKKRLLFLLLSLLALTGTALATRPVPNALTSSGERDTNEYVSAWGAKLLCARYDENGRFLSLEELEELPEKWDGLGNQQLFLLERTTFRPLCEAVTSESTPVLDAGLLTRRYSSDNMGRPQTEWFHNGRKIASRTESPALIYTGNVRISQIYDDLGMTTPGEGYLYINGVEFASGDKADLENDDGFTKGSAYFGSVSRDNSARLDRLSEYYTRSYQDYLGNRAWEPKLGKGSWIEVYYNEKTNQVWIAAMSTYSGKIAAVEPAGSEGNDYVIVEAGSRDPYTANIKELGASPMTYKYTDIEAFAKNGHNEGPFSRYEPGDVVGFTYSDRTEEITGMYKLQSSAKGLLTRRTASKNLTLDDITYSYSQEYSFGGGLSEDTLRQGDEYIVYSDYDYVLWIEEAAPSAGDLQP